MSAVACQVSTSDLIGLFAGDEHSRGYPTFQLAYALCDRLEPASAGQLKDLVYGEDWPLDEIPVGEREELARAFVAWKRMGEG